MGHYDEDNHDQLDGKQAQERNRVRLFLAIYNHKWLTAKQLGVIGWPKQNKDARRVSAFRFIKAAIKDGFLLDRKIDRVGGTIAVLSLKGAQWMSGHGYSCIGANKWGHFEDNVNWTPPSNYFHDFMINEYLTVELHQISQDRINSESFAYNDAARAYDFQHINEREFKKTNQHAQIPDGMYWDENDRMMYGTDNVPVTFIECESHRKTGIKMRKMMLQTAKRAQTDEFKLDLWLHPIQIERNQPKTIKFGAATTTFIYDIHQRDERGFKIDHQKRLISGLRQLIQGIQAWRHVIGDHVDEITIHFAPFDSKTMQFLASEYHTVNRSIPPENAHWLDR